VQAKLSAKTIKNLLEKETIKIYRSKCSSNKLDYEEHV
jgi:hypothetical protein